MSVFVSPLDRCGTMIRAAAVLGQSHAKRDFKPYLTWNTEARTRAYLDAYRAALSPSLESPQP